MSTATPSTFPAAPCACLDADNDYSTLYEPLLVGLRCTLTETDSGGATSTTITDAETGDPVDIIEIAAETPAVTVTNTFDVGDLTVTKTVSGADAAAHASDELRGDHLVRVGRRDDRHPGRCRATGDDHRTRDVRGSPGRCRVHRAGDGCRRCGRDDLHAGVRRGAGRGRRRIGATETRQPLTIDNRFDARPAAATRCRRRDWTRRRSSSRQGSPCC